MSMNSIMSNTYKARIENRKHQLTSKLIGPQQQIHSESTEPESLLKIIQNDKGGFLYVTDETFTFFKLLLVKLKRMQNTLSVQWNAECSFLQTNLTLCSDIEILESWINLFKTSEDPSNCDCKLNEFQEEESDELSHSSLVEMQMDEVLILDIMEDVIFYFSKVHFAETVFKLKDFILEKPKTFQLRHTVDESKQSSKTTSFPCGVCQKECIDIISKKKASFDDFSVECDGCHIWYHYICLNLSGNESPLHENSTIPYFCPSCKAAKSSDRNNELCLDSNVSEGQEDTDPWKVNAKTVDVKLSGHGRGRGRGTGRGWQRPKVETAAASKDRQTPENTSISSRGCKRKAVNMDDYVL